MAATLDIDFLVAGLMRYNALLNLELPSASERLNVQADIAVLAVAIVPVLSMHGRMGSEVVGGPFEGPQVKLFQGS